MSPPCCRSYMPSSDVADRSGRRSRRSCPAKQGRSGRRLIIWCTIGVSASRAPARGGDLRRPDAAADHDVGPWRSRPFARDDAGDPFGLGRDVKDLGAGDDRERRAAGLRPLAQFSVPAPQACRPTPDRGEVAAAKDDGRGRGRGTSFWPRLPGSGARPGMPQGLGPFPLTRRFKLLHPLRACGRPSMPPDSGEDAEFPCTARSSSLVSSNISLEYSIGKTKLDAWPVLAARVRQRGPLSTSNDVFSSRAGPDGGRDCYLRCRRAYYYYCNWLGSASQS